MTDTPSYYGFRTPTGNDLISEGDDDIRVNAERMALALDSVKFDRSGIPLTAETNIDTLRSSVYASWGGATSAALGLPEGSLGTLINVRYGTGAGNQLWLTRGLAPAVYARSELSSGWSPWVKIGPAPSVTSTARLRAASPAALKSAPLALTLGHGGSQTTGSGTTTVAQHMPATATRVRLRLRNRNPRYDLADEAPAAITACAIGLHDGGNGTSSSWVALPGNGSTPWASEWITVPPALRGKEIVVRYTWSSSGTVQRNIGTAWSAPGVRDNNPPLHAWLELEVPASTPVLGALGDSLTAGVGSARPIIDSWLGQYARSVGAIPAHFAHSGDSVGTWTDTAQKWYLYGADIAALDALLLTGLSNDIFGGASSSEAKTRATNAVAIIKDRLTPNVYAATVLPRTGATGAPETIRRDVNAWMKTSGLFRDVYDFAAAVSADDETLRPEYDADGTHLNTSGYAAMAAAITRPILPAVTS